MAEARHAVTPPDLNRKEPEPPDRRLHYLETSNNLYQHIWQREEIGVKATFASKTVLLRGITEPSDGRWWRKRSTGVRSDAGTSPSPWGAAP